MLRGNEEYALALIKPDGVEKNLLYEVVCYLKENGMVEIARSTKKLNRTYVGEIFTTKHNGVIFKNYMTRGESTAILVKGKNAFDNLRILKVEFRKKYSVDGMIENILHSPEAGNEYEAQLKYYFPNITDNMHCLFCDMYVRVHLEKNYVLFKNLMDYYRNNTNAKLIYIFNNEEFSELQENFSCYVDETKWKNWVWGIEYNSRIGKERIKLVGYYSTNNILDVYGGNNYFYDNPREVVKYILENQGVPYLGYCSSRIELSDEIGLVGVLTYHPQYTIQDTEVIREVFCSRGLLMTSGSGGIVTPGKYAASYAIFNFLYNKLYSRDYVLLDGCESSE